MHNIENEELPLKKQQQDNFFTEHLLKEQEKERKYLAGELHNTIGQNLILIKNKLLQLKSSFPASDVNNSHLNDAFETLTHTIQQIRNISFELRPYELDMFGLTQALYTLTEPTPGIQYTTNIEQVDALFPAESETQIYRLTQEALLHIIKRTDAFVVRLAVYNRQNNLEIWLGCTGTATSPPCPVSDFEMLKIQERINILSGTFTYKTDSRHSAAMCICIPLPYGK